MKLRKWNYDKREYEPYEVPDSWSVKTYSDDMDELVNCCQCGGVVPFGECYTSHEVHTEHGMGYAVCGKCYFQDENVRYYKDSGIKYDPGKLADVHSVERRGMTNWESIYLHNIAIELKNIREILEKQSTTEQSSIVGEWKWESEDVCDNCAYEIPHLERIVGETVLMDSKDWNYCPNCGCKRRG